MMFKGTNTIGTTDYRSRDGDHGRTRRDPRRDGYRVHRAARGQTPRRGRRKHLPAREPDPAARRTPREDEGTPGRCSASTSSTTSTTRSTPTRGPPASMPGTNADVTVYFIDVPANKLELWFWMESDRLLNAVFREFYSERDVVREERRLRVESNPTAKFEEQFDFMFWGSVPYHHPTIGWPSDVESINRAQAESSSTPSMRRTTSPRLSSATSTPRGHRPRQEVLRPDSPRRESIHPKSSPRRSSRFRNAG